MKQQYLTPCFFTAENPAPYTGERGFFVRGTNYVSSGPGEVNCFHIRFGGLDFYLEDAAARELMHHLRIHFGLPRSAFAPSPSQENTAREGGAED